MSLVELSYVTGRTLLSKIFVNVQLLPIFALNIFEQNEWHITFLVHIFANFRKCLMSLKYLFK